MRRTTLTTTAWVIVSLAVAIIPTDLRADRVELTTGAVVDGHILGISKTHVSVALHSGGSVSFQKRWVRLVRINRIATIYREQLALIRTLPTSREHFESLLEEGSADLAGRRPDRSPEDPAVTIAPSSPWTLTIEEPTKGDDGEVASPVRSAPRAPAATIRTGPPPGLPEIPPQTAGPFTATKPRVRSAPTAPAVTIRTADPPELPEIVAETTPPAPTIRTSPPPETTPPAPETGGAPRQATDAPPPTIATVEPETIEFPLATEDTEPDETRPALELSATQEKATETTTTSSSLPPLEFAFSPPKGFVRWPEAEDFPVVEAYREPVTQATLMVSSYTSPRAIVELKNRAVDTYRNQSRKYRLLRDERFAEAEQAAWAVEVVSHLPGLAVHQLQLFTGIRSTHHSHVIVVTLSTAANHFPAHRGPVLRSLEGLRLHKAPPEPSTNAPAPVDAPLRTQPEEFPETLPEFTPDQSRSR